jgi:hypothetical protein
MALEGEFNHNLEAIKSQLNGLTRDFEIFSVRKESRRREWGHWHRSYAVLRRRCGTVIGEKDAHLMTYPESLERLKQLLTRVQKVAESLTGLTHHGRDKTFSG